MMKLELMKRFFDTVDGDWRSPIADELASRWLLGAPSVRCIRASANFVFRVHAAGHKYVLRFNHDSERQPELIASELEYVQHLARRGIHVARPIPSLAGRTVESVATALGAFHGALFEALCGEEMELDNLGVEGLQRWGRALGDIHNASAGVAIAGRPTWADHLAMARQIIPRSEAAARTELDALEALLRELPVTAANFGLIHYDFELDNILWRDGQAGVYDCDDCAWYWFAADVVNALRDLFDDRAERVDAHDERLQCFLRGYRSVRRLEERDLQHAPLLLRANNLVLFARVYRSLEEGPLPGEPPWTAQLRAKLSGVLDRYRQSFRDHPISSCVSG